MTVPDMRCKQPVVEGIQVRGRGAIKATAKRRDVQRQRSRIYRDCDVSGDTWCAAGIADPTHHQLSKCRIARPDNVTFGCVRIVVVHATRTIGSV